MSNQIDKNTLIKAMKDLVYVSTESGPVVPSKTKVIKMLTKQIPDPVKKPQDGEDWDHRTYDMNKPLTYGKNLITTRDLYKKVFTEAVTNTAYRGMRMNLSSIDMQETHCKFIINRRDHEMLVELFYPNENGNITVKLTADTSLSNLYEVPLDSPQFTKNFGYTILKTCDDLIDSNNTYDLGNDLDTMQFVNGLGNGTEEPSNSLMATDSSIYHESVGSELGQLLNLCNAVNLLEDSEQAPGAENFAMGNVDEAPVPDNIPGINSGDVNGTDSAEDGDDIVNFADYMKENLSEVQTINASGDSVNGDSSMLDNLGKMISEKMADMVSGKNKQNSGIALSGKEIYTGTTGIKDQAPTAVLKAFFDYYPELNTDVKVSQIDQFVDYLTNPGTDNLSLAEFNDKLAELFPEVYSDGASEEDSQMSIDSVGVPGESKFNGTEPEYNPDEAVDPSVLGAGGTDNDFMNDGSFGAMIDQVGGGDVPLPDENEEDFGIGGDAELGADNGPSQQAVDKQDEVIGAMTNI